MELVDFANRNGQFYAPAFRVRVGGVDLVKEMLVPVASVDADLPLGAAGRFGFTIVNAYDLERQGFFSGNGSDILAALAFGATVEITMGYGTISNLPPLITGTITEISTNFPDGGYPELNVAGYDRAFPLTVGKNSQTWRKKKDSDVVASIASSRNLTPDIEATAIEHPQIEQNQETDIEFIAKLAKRNDYEFYVYRDTLRFGKAKNQGSGVVSLDWGRGLLSFKPEANLAGQISRVEVHGWDLANANGIVGRAGAGDESGRNPRAQSAADLLTRNQPVLRIRQPVFTQAEADNRARAALNEQAKKFLTGDAETLGLPEIRPDVNVTLGKLGVPFSRTYYVHQASHKFDSNGYRTRFKVKETTL